MTTTTRIATLRTADEFRAHLDKLNITLPFDETVQHGSDAPLAQALSNKLKPIGNRFAILPMEGWDGTEDGRPSAETTRRWQRFGQSGAKLIWGGEAVAIRHEARANPNQLVINERTVSDLAQLRETLTAAHKARFSRADDLLIGLQLTHSGRFSKPNDKKRMEPRTVYQHPWLDAKFHVKDSDLLSDAEIDDIIAEMGSAARLAQQAGFEFVDLKHCHGYLGHEFLSAHTRPGKYGGSFENRTRYLRDCVASIRAAAPGLHIGVRLSAFDWMPFKPGPDGTGVADRHGDTAYPFAFGGDGTGVGIDLTEPHLFLSELEKLGIELVCLSAGSPYYNPHIQRPALFPPSDGYQPPEDPLVGVARQINVTTELKRQHPNLIFVGTGYSYLQDWLPNVAQAAVRTGAVDSVGIGRMVLSYPEMVADTLEGRALQRKSICRTFSDCTTGPRNGLISGCYPLDPYYKAHPQRELLEAAKKN